MVPSKLCVFLIKLQENKMKIVFPVFFDIHLIPLEFSSRLDLDFVR